MAWFTKTKPINPDMMATALVLAAAAMITGELRKALAPTVYETQYEDFDTELLLFALFPFDLAVVASGHTSVDQIRRAMLRHSLDAANAERAPSGRGVLTAGEWLDRVRARFRQYGECLATPSDPGRRADTMHLLGNAAAKNITGASKVDMSLATLLSSHYTATLIFARKLVESIELGHLVV